jgi:hypothetical protein
MCRNPVRLPVPANIVATGKFQYWPDFTVLVSEFGNRQFFDVTAVQARIYMRRFERTNVVAVAE